MKRHERPYGCTFYACNKSFGSKNDWKRHENSQHFHLETWRCDEEKQEGVVCAKAYYRQQTFKDHLKKDHKIVEEDEIKAKVESCRIGRNCNVRFWCGFCSKLIDLKGKGLDAWTERFDHIDDHFMGRNKQPKKNIQDWIPLDSQKTKEDMEKASPQARVESSDEDSQLAIPSEHVASKIGESAEAPVPVAAEKSKRGRFSSDEDEAESRPAAKHQKTVATREVFVYCVGLDSLKDEG